MKRTIKSSFFKSISLALGFQLMFAPLAQALDNSMVNTMANTAGQLSNTFQEMMMMKQQQQMTQQMAQGLETYKTQQVPPNQIAIPIFAGCQIYMAATNKPQTGQRCEPPADPMMISYYSSLIDVATYNVEKYSPFAPHDDATLKGNSKSIDGNRCLADAETQFKAMLDSRREEINKLIESLNEQLAAFNELNAPLVEQIKQGNALLFGTPKELLADTKFDTKFNDPQCMSMIDGTTINSLALGKGGAKGGYEAIKDHIKNLTDSSKNGGYNAKSFVAQASNIKRDIKNVANQLSKKAQSMSSQLLLGDKGKSILQDSIKSKYNLKSLPGFSEALDRQMGKLTEAQGNIGTIISSMSPEEAGALQKNLFDPEMNTSQIVRNYKNLSSTSCIQQVFEKRFKGVDNFVELLENPSISKKMNKEADNKLKNSLPSLLSNSNLSLEEKLNEIKKISGVKNYRYKAQKTETINGVSLNAGGYVQVDDLFKDIIIQDCERLANSNNAQGETPNNIANRISEYHTELRQVHQAFPSQLKADLEEELLECPNDTSVGSPGTCSSSSFDLTSGNANFCLRTASTCASNMLACADKAEKIFDVTRKEQLKLANSYKKNLEITKKKLFNDYIGVKKLLETKARQLDQMFPGQVYNVAIDEELNLKTEKESLFPESDIDPSLKIEDPKQYVEQMIANLKKISNKEGTGSIDQQNKAIAKNIEEEKNNIIKNAIKEKDFWQKIADSCNSLINQYNANMGQEMAEKNRQIEEQNNQIAEFCAEARKISSCPTEGEVDSLNSSASQIAAYLQPGDSTALNNYKKMARLCGTSGSESVNPFEATGEGFKAFPNIEKACKEMGNQVACSNYTSLSNNIATNYSSEDRNDIRSQDCSTLNDENAQQTCKRDQKSDLKDFDKEKTALEEKLKEAEIEIAKLWKQYQGFKVAKEMGQQSFPSCNSMAGGEVGKSFGDATRDIAGAIQQNKAFQQ